MDCVGFCLVTSLVGVAVASRLLARRGPLWIQRAGECYQRGDVRDASRWSSFALWFGGSDCRFNAYYLRMYCAADLGETRRAVDLAYRILYWLSRVSGEPCPWLIVNAAVVVLINGGHYTAALAAPARWTPEQQEQGREDGEEGFVLTRINVAEALCNLGRIDEALATFDEVHEPARNWPLALAGLGILRGWILLQAGRIDEARVVLDGTDTAAIEPAYTAEVEYTRAALERDSGRLDLAMSHAERGLAWAKRASSRRNGLFMIASIAALAGDHERARRTFEEGARARYRAQSGEGLNRYARYLESLGERDAAKRVRRWIARRDPEWRDPMAS